MATQLLAKFEENAPAQSTGLRRQVRRNLVLDAFGALVNASIKDGSSCLGGAFELERRACKSPSVAKQVIKAALAF